MNPCQDIKSVQKTLAIIIVAMIAGIGAFAAVSLILQSRIASKPELANMFILILGLIGVSEMGAWVVLSPQLVKRAREAVRSAAAEQRESVVNQNLATQTIIAAALVEGFGLLGTVLFWVSGARLLLAAPVVAVAFLVTLLPTDQRIERFRMSVGS